MPPKKKISKAKLHVLAPQVSVGFKFSDSMRREFIMGKQFATGGFGRIHTCVQTGNSDRLVVKVEPSGNGPLFTEVNVFQRILKADQIAEFVKLKKLKFVGVPHLISSGIFEYGGESLRYLVMPWYTTSLEAIREREGKLTETASLSVAKAMLYSLEYIHSKNYTHGDLKAANILLPSLTDFAGAVLVDFGLARMASSNQEKPDKKRAHNGTAIFTSLDAHCGLQPSYRGDIEILFYNIIYWLTGRLPWLKDEGAPSVVQAAKEKARKDVASFLEKNLLAKSLRQPLTDFYAEVLQTEYTEGVDFEHLHSILKKAATSTRKSEVVGPSPSRTKPRPGPSPSRTKPRPLKKMNEKAPATETEPSEESSVSEEFPMRTGKSRVVGEGKERAAAKKRPASNAKKVPAKRPTPQEEEESDNDSEQRSSKLRVAAMKRAPAEEEREDSDSENDSSQRSSKPSHEKGSVKRNSDELRRMVPGMRNLPKGRRSIIIKKIVKNNA